MGRLPTMPPIGFSCALKGSCCQQRGPAASTATTTDTLVPITQTTSPTTPRLSAFFMEVVCTLGTTQPHVAASPPPNGGNGVIRTTTRRRHADSQPLMLQNPHRYRYGGRRRVRRARARHRRDRKAGLRAAGPGWTTSRSADRSSRRGRLAGRPRRSPAPRPGLAPRKSAGPQSTTSATQQHVVSYNPNLWCYCLIVKRSIGNCLRDSGIKRRVELARTDLKLGFDRIEQF